jgi:hypothetical protein
MTLTAEGLSGYLRAAACQDDRDADEELVARVETGGLV